MIYREFWGVSVGVAAALTMFGCLDEDNHGYPHKIAFTAEGGEIVVQGSTSITSVDFDKDIPVGPSRAASTREYYAVVDDTVFISSDWLAIKLPLGQKQAIFIAEPNESSSRRRQKLEVSFGDSFGFITVEQDFTR
mgnify:CR=1 FL=1